MANDLATLRTKLATALRDPTMETWPSAELDDLLTWSCRSLYPRVAVEMSLPVYPLVTDQEDYDIPSGILEVSRVDLAQVSDDSLLYPLPGGTWEVYGDVWNSTAKLFINKVYSNPDYYLVVHGYGIYDLVDSTPPDHWVPYILARSRAEAYRRIAGDRARYEQWLASNQTQNMSVNELLNLIQDADSEADRQWRTMPRTVRRPVPGRV